MSQNFRQRVCSKAINRLKLLAMNDHNQAQAYLWLVKTELDKAACTSSSTEASNILWGTLKEIKSHKPETIEDIKRILTKGMNRIHKFTPSLTNLEEEQDEDPDRQRTD